MPARDGSAERTLVARCRERLLDAAALVAPIDCVGCGAPDRALCPDCAAQLAPAPRTAFLDASPGHGFPLVAGAAYEGVVRAAILALKEEGRTELAHSLRPPLLTALEFAYAEPGARDALLVPVPGSPVALGRRGFHPVELLARRAGLVLTRALEFAPGAVSQKQRSLAARTAERGEPRVTRALVGRSVVLVDDVVTSGATLRAAARALTRSGAVVRAAAAVAATPRRQGASSIPWSPPITLSPCRADAS